MNVRAPRATLSIRPRQVRMTSTYIICEYRDCTYMKNVNLQHVFVLPVITISSRVVLLVLDISFRMENIITLFLLYM